MSIHQIAVISDTHNRLPKSHLERFQQANEIWHLGDVCTQKIIEPLQQLGPELFVVKGNCDPHFIWPDFLELERHGHTFRLQHLPPTQGNDNLAAILHGHLHYPVRTKLANTLVLNPGAITGPRNGSECSFAWLRFLEDGSWTWDIELL